MRSSNKQTVLGASDGARRRMLGARVNLRALNQWLLLQGVE